jgi:glycosyltransferase involved in cell wall biosynthesis
MRGAVVIQVCRGREWRGGERQVRLLVQTLAWRSGFLQHVFTGQGSTLARALDPSGPALHSVAWSLGLDPRAFAALWTMLRRLQRTNDRNIVLHAHDSHALALAAIPARFFGLPLIATRRSMTPPGRLWRLPDRVIAISNAVEQVLRRVGVEPARIVRIPSAVSLADMARVSIESHSPGSDEGIPVVLAVGALSAEKGHATLIEALPLLRREVPHVQLVLVGEGPERRRLEALVRALRVTGSVRFLGDRPTASNLICAAQVLAQPSHREALGTAVLEAMALGTPVVATATGGLVELLGEGAGLLVPPGDAPALANGLARVLTDALLRAALVHEARARVADYDAPGVADRVAEVYRSALRKI